MPKVTIAQAEEMTTNLIHLIRIKEAAAIKEASAETEFRTAVNAASNKMSSSKHQIKSQIETLEAELGELQKKLSGLVIGGNEESKKVVKVEMMDKTFELDALKAINLYDCGFKMAEDEFEKVKESFVVYMAANSVLRSIAYDLKEFAAKCAKECTNIQKDNELHPGFGGSIGCDFVLEDIIEYFVDVHRSPQKTENNAKRDAIDSYRHQNRGLIKELEAQFLEEINNAK